MSTKLELIPHIKQSIIDILTTPTGSRVMRREYGSKLFNLIDERVIFIAPSGDIVVEDISLSAPHTRAKSWRSLRRRRFHGATRLNSQLRYK